MPTAGMRPRNCFRRVGHLLGAAPALLITVSGTCQLHSSQEGKGRSVLGRVRINFSFPERKMRLSRGKTHIECAASEQWGPNPWFPPHLKPSTGRQMSAIWVCSNEMLRLHTLMLAPCHHIGLTKHPYWWCWSATLIRAVGCLLPLTAVQDHLEDLCAE